MKVWCHFDMNQECTHFATWYQRLVMHFIDSNRTRHHVRHAFACPSMIGACNRSRNTILVTPGGKNRLFRTHLLEWKPFNCVLLLNLRRVGAFKVTADLLKRHMRRASRKRQSSSVHGLDQLSDTVLPIGIAGPIIRCNFGHAPRFPSWVRSTPPFALSALHLDKRYWR